MAPAGGMVLIAVAVVTVVLRNRSVLVPIPEKILVIDDNAESRFLLVKTLERKFPGTAVVPCDDAERALDLAAHDPACVAIVTHRTAEIRGIELLACLRAANHAIPIVMVSGIDRRDAALSAGADAFLLYDEWLRIGTLVADTLQRRRGPHPTRPPEDDADPDNLVIG